MGEFYDQMTDLYTELWDDNLHVGYWHDNRDQASIEVATEQLTDELISKLAPRAGQRVLDVGCGVGKPAIRLALLHDVEVVGISISEKQIARANTEALRADVASRVRFEYANATDLPFRDASFNAAWAIESLLHISDKSQALREIARVLCPDSYLVVADMFHQPQGRLDQGIVRTIGFEDYRGLLEQAGMIPVEITDVTAHIHMPETVKKTFGTRRARLRGRRNELVQRLGVERFERLTGSHRDVLNDQEFGYLFIVAQRE